MNKTNKTWGGRFKKPLDERVMQFHSSLHFDFILAYHDIEGSVAHVKMLLKQGLITNREFKDICKGLLEICQDMQSNAYEFGRSCEDIHMFIEQQLIKKIGDTGKKLHTGRSRNDQVALTLKLFLRDAANNAQELLEALISKLKQLSKKYLKNIMPGYTHLQQAQPISLGKYFEAYMYMFKRDLSRLEDWRKRADYSPLGAGALAGSTLPLDRRYVAKELGFKGGIVENTIDAVSDRDFIIELCSVSSVIMIHLSRLCEDLILWSTKEFNFVILDDAFATGSSLMPNKKNPDVLELIRGKSGRVFGNLFNILTVMKGLPLAYNKDMQEDKEAVFDSMDTVMGCLSIIHPFLDSLKFNTEIMKMSAESGYLDATQILEEMVKQGVPFRDAHHKVGQLVREAIDKGISLRDLMSSKRGH